MAVAFAVQDSFENECNKHSLRLGRPGAFWQACTVSGIIVGFNPAAAVPTRSMMEEEQEGEEQGQEQEQE